MKGVLIVNTKLICTVQSLHNTSVKTAKTIGARIAFIIKRFVTTVCVSLKNIKY